MSDSDRSGRFTPLEAYGLVGNLETTALIADDGSVDWLPFPHVESPSVFAAVLDTDVGGQFSIRPTTEFRSEQGYREATNVLETTFWTDDGRATVVDFMPVADHEYPGGTPDCALYREIRGEDGPVEFDVAFAPAFDYARTSPTLEATAEFVRAGGDESDPELFLVGEGEFETDHDRASATVTVSVGPDETAWFVLADSVPESDPEAILSETLDYWRGWAHNCPDERACVFGGPWHDDVVRSGLLLKLLTHHETGAIAAAPTTSLPEEIGGVRNWDYRYAWIRDASFTAQALYNLGHVSEAHAYFGWLTALCQVSPEHLKPLYSLHGDDDDLTEVELDHLSGYRDSKPVRIGNAAADQLQLDMYGELVDAVSEISRYGLDIDQEDWAAVREIVDFVVEAWERPDEGIWEVRCDPRQFVYSKVMCWVALDRGIDMLDTGGFDGPREEWETTREEIRETVLERGYDEEVESFVRSFDSQKLDATSLLIPMTGFLPFDDDRVQNTIDATIDRLGEDGLVARYEGEDGLPGEEGAFLLCSFWLVDALSLSGRTEEARERFEDALEYVSPAGLLSEEIDPETGHHLGNTPQAFSHIGLINSALYLGRVGGKRHSGPEIKGADESPVVRSDEADE